MKGIFIISIVALCVSCQSNNQSDKIKVVNSLPVRKGLAMTVKKLQNPILASRAMFVSGDHLFVHKERDSTLFDVFRLPDCDYLYSYGIRGGGPNDFNMLDNRGFRPTPTGFEALEAGVNILKTIEFTDEGLKTVKQSQLIGGRKGGAMNGLYWLGDDNYLSYGAINSPFEYRFLHANDEKVTDWGDYPTWAKLDKELPANTFMAYLKASVVNPRQDKFASFYIQFKRWRVYSMKGELLKDIDVQVEPDMTDINAKPGDRYTYYVGQPLAVGDCIYVLCCNNKENDRDPDMDKTELQVWDWEGNPLACYPLGQRITAFAVSEKYNRMYMFSNGVVDDEIYICELPKP